MLYKKNDSSVYVSEFKKRFENFCSKAPLLMSYTTTPNLVQIVDESTDMVYEIPFDFSIPVKSFIYGIKQYLIQNQCYPIIEKWETISTNLSPEEAIELASQPGVNLDLLPKTKEEVVVKKFLIDKVIVYRDIFILRELETNKMYRFLLRKSSIFFLKKLRTKQKSLKESGDYFFENATLLNEIDSKEEDQ